jgi:hypothetical protein
METRSTLEPRHFPRIGSRLNGNNKPEKFDARIQIVTERWNRVVAVPYLVYMPEKDRLLMLVSCDYPHRPFVLWSDDRGLTWTDPKPVENASNDPSHHVAVSLTYLGQGKVAFSIETLGRYFSDDYGCTWQAPIPKPPASNGKPWYQWDPYWVDKDADGKIVRLTETGYTCTGDTISGGHAQAEIRYSSDEGRIWTSSKPVPQWKGVNEVSLIRAANGDLVAACRTENPERFRNEIDHYEGLAVSISKDNGESWSPLNRLYEYGRHHPSMVLLPCGEIVMTYVVRKGYPDTHDGFPQFGIEAVISRDHGRTWDLDHHYILAEWAGNRKGENSWWPSCQATSSVLLPDGTILTAFGTGYRCQGDEKTPPTPRDVGLIYWNPKI